MWNIDTSDYKSYKSQFILNSRLILESQVVVHAITKIPSIMELAVRY